MKELKEYRVNLINRLEKAATAFRDECLAVQDPYAALEENGWSVHQIAVHTRDSDRLVYGLRVRRTAMEDNPEFQSFDGDVYMAENYDASESLSELLDGFVGSVTALVELLRALPDNAWARVSRHNTLGSNLTLQTWVEKNLAHIEEHLKAIQKQTTNKFTK